MYGSAVLLSWLAAYLSLHVQALHATPLSLNFAAIVAVAAFFGEGPAIVSVFASAIAFQVYLPTTMRTGPAPTLIRIAVILLAGGLITLIINLAVVMYLLYAKRLFGLRGGGAADAALREADSGWPALERTLPR